MAKELFCNDTTTTLSSAVSSSGQTTFTVTSGENFPKIGDFRILIGTEICIVTAVTYNDFTPATWTVTRGVEGTSATTYASGTTVDLIITAASLQRIFRGRIDSGVIATHVAAMEPPSKGDFFIPTDSFYTMVIFDGVGWKFMHHGQEMTPPNFETWTSESPDVNFTLDTTRKASMLFDANPTPGIHIKYRAVPATPYTFTIACLPHYGITGHGYNNVGLGWRSSASTTGFTLWGVAANNSSSWYMRAYNFSNLTTYSGGDFVFTNVAPMVVHGSLTWLRLADNGTTKSVQMSSNGINWTIIGSQSSSTTFTPAYMGVQISDMLTGVNIGQTIVHMAVA